MRHIFLALFLIGPTISVPANDNGPYAPPCTNCPEYSRPPYPHTGLWYNPQRSGTGINIDVQNGIMAAVYYGYREDGSAIWLLFSSKLEQSETEDVYWEVEADLYEGSNGEPINGEHQFPDMEVVGTIHVEFMQRHLLRFSIDGGPYQRMAPQMFGSHFFQPFEPDSDLRVPDTRSAGVFETHTLDMVPWLIVQKNPDGDSPWEFGFVAYRPHWGQSSTSNDPGSKYSITFWEHDALPHIQQSAQITCGNAEDLTQDSKPSLRDRFQGVSEPMCVVYSLAGTPPDGESRVYFMPVGNLGDRRFSAVSEDGWIIEGFRLMYD